MQKLHCHSAVSFAMALTYAGYKDIPVSWMLCEDNLCVPERSQREMIEGIEKVSGER